MVDGMWTEMLRRCDDGAEILREKCRGVSWELAIAGAAAERRWKSWAVPSMPCSGSRLPFSRPAKRRTSSASARAFSIVEWCTYCRDAHTKRAKRPSDRAKCGPDRAFDATLLRHAAGGLRRAGRRSTARSAPARGRPLGATSPGPNCLRHALIGVDAHLLAARVRIAVPNTGGDMVRRARWHARRIVAAGTAPMRGHGHMIEAAIALAAGDRAQSIAHLRDAAGLFERAEMRLSEAAAMHLLARFCVDARTHDATANAIFARAGIDDVARHMRLYGFLPLFDVPPTRTPASPVGEQLRRLARCRGRRTR